MSDLMNDIGHELQRMATRSTAEFVGRSMSNAMVLDTRERVLDFALRHVSLDEGLYCEFGVADGHTIRHIAEFTPSRSMHGFDCFTGLPERWNGLEARHFECEIPSVQENVILHVGLFEDTLPQFVADHPRPIAFLHIDSDLYSSAVTVLQTLKPHIVRGTVIVFDEFFNYPSWEQHEARAWHEFIQHGLKFEYLCYNRIGEQVALQVL